MRLFELITYGPAYLRHFDRNVAPKASSALVWRAPRRAARRPALQRPRPRADPRRRRTSACLVVADSATLQDAGVPSMACRATSTPPTSSSRRSRSIAPRSSHNISPLLYDTRLLRAQAAGLRQAHDLLARRAGRQRRPERLQRALARQLPLADRRMDPARPQSRVVRAGARSGGGRDRGAARRATSTSPSSAPTAGCTAGATCCCSESPSWHRRCG